MGGGPSKPRGRPKKQVMDMDVAEIKNIKAQAQRELNTITDKKKRAEYESYITQLNSQQAKLEANKTKQQRLNAEREKVITQRSRYEAQRAKNDAKTAEITAQRARQGAQKEKSDAEKARWETQRAEFKAKKAKSGALTAQSDALMAKNNTEIAQKDSEKILTNLENDNDVGMLASQIINPTVQAAIINHDKNYLENLKDTIEKKETFMNFLNSNDKEGFDVMDFFNLYINNEEERIAMEEKDLQIQINDVKKHQGLEFGALRNDILGKNLMNYMINEEGTNVEKVYNKLNQENNDALRKIQISNYYTKSYKEYINLLKIILIAIAIIIPILIFNKLEIINKNISLLSITLIILLTSIFCIYRIYLLYMKDPINFDKIKIPYDRQMRELNDQKKLKYKDSPFKSAGITCLGDECCDNDMIYDNIRNKCINKRQEIQESFHNYFDNAMKINNSNKNIIQQNDIPESQKTFSYLGGNANIVKNSNHIKEGLTNRRNLLQQLAGASLKNSSYDKF
jgi:hypothetical protein